jgi:plasmid maintenance system antidote protein VapI
MAQTGMNNIRLAKSCSIHPITVSALLNQRRDPTPETAATIARALHCKPADLFPEVERE